MLLEFGNAKAAATERFDVIIAGAGAVGLCLAIDLARSGVKVALLEAGPTSTSADSQKIFKEAISSGHELPGLHLGRFRCLGGTTNFWGGQLVPFQPHIFSGRPKLGIPSWPIDSKSVEPYYKTAFDLLGLDSVLHDDRDVWESLKLESPPASSTITPFFTRWAPEANFARLFDKEIKDSENLTVVLNAPVRDIVYGNDGGVTSLIAGNHPDHTINFSAKQFVLACGTIEISRLLLISGQKRDAPWASNSWIGKGFLDHVDIYAGSVHPINKPKFFQFFENAVLKGIKYAPKLRLSNQAQLEEGLLDVSAHFVFKSSVSESINNLKILAKGLLRGRLKTIASINPIALIKTLRFVIPMAIRYLRYRRISSFADGGILLRLTSEQTPLPNSEISLTENRDSIEMPIARVNWVISPEDATMLQRFALIVANYLETSDIAKVELSPLVKAGDPRILETADDANHQMGGARMGFNEQDGVVDANLRVFGTTNLFVAGQAVFPSSGFANPTFTAIALGLRLSEHLKQGLAAA